MQSEAATVAQYLATLPPDRREIVETVRQVVLANLDDDIEETMQYGMIGYVVPHRVFPDGYHCDPRQPLPFAGLASQKNHLSLYLMPLYLAAGGKRPEGGTPAERRFRKLWEASGKRLDMGKSCIRFKKLDDLALGAISDLLARTTAASYVKLYRSIAPMKKPAAKGKARGPKAERK
jgi:hypothetical protein